MTPDQIRALDVPTNSISAILARELAAQIAQLNIYMAAVSTTGIPVQVTSANPAGFPVVVEPTPAAGQPAGS